MRLLILLCLTCLLLPLKADDLSSRLRLLLPGDEPATVNARQFLFQRVNQLLATLKEEDKVDRKSVKKQIRRIESRLKKDHFRTYAVDADLADVFRRGRYNDATAAVLTALTYEEFGIAYEGYVDHWEAYLIADPDGRREVIRSPDGQKRKANEAANYRREYLDLVAKTLELDFSGANQAAMDEAFERYFYDPDKRLTFGQLSAYLQYRRAQAVYAGGDFPLTITVLEKALQREERPAFLVLKRAAELQLAAINRPEVEGDVSEFFQLWSENPNNRYLPAAILQHFDEQQRLLIAQGRTDLAENLLADYLGRAPAGRGEWTLAMSQLQRLRLLNHYYQRGQHHQAKETADELYAELPENETIRYILGELVINELRQAGGGDGFTQRVEAAAERYPFIRKQDRFADLLLRELAWKVRDLYAEDRPDVAGPALERFRQALVDIPIGRERNLWTLTAFAAASNYHFRIEDYHGARKFIEEALRYAPEDPYLTHRRFVLGRY